MKITDKERKKYINEIQKLLVCDPKERRIFVRDFNSDIDDFISDNPEASIDELEKAMGTPQEIADGFMSNASPKDIKKRTSIARIVLLVSVITMGLIVIFYASAWIDAYESNRGQYDEVTVDHSVIEEGTDASTVDQ